MELQTQNPETINLLKKLISIDSTNPFKTKEINGKTVGVGNEKEISEYLENILKKEGFYVERQQINKEVPERFNILAEKGKGEKSVMFVGHMDTVEVKQGWKTNPFEAVEKQGRIYGLGSNDMKAGLSAIINSTKDVNPNGHKIKIAFVVDEEYWSYGTEKLLQSDFIDDVSYAIVPEVGEFENKTDKQPIVIGRMGRTEYEINIKGQSCHGAQARLNKDAINAVHESTRLQNSLLRYCEDCSKTFEEDGMKITNSAYLSRIEGGKATLSVPEKARIIIDRSFVPGEDMENEINKIKKIIEEEKSNNNLNKNTQVEVKERERPTKPARPYYSSQKNPVVRGITEIVDEITGGHEYGIAFSVADENRFAGKGITTIRIGPKGENSHSPQEWVDVQSLENLTTIYRKIAGNFLE